jgi:hypothetical protein
MNELKNEEARHEELIKELEEKVEYLKGCL